MKIREGQRRIYETEYGREEAFYFDIDGKKHWVKRFLKEGRYEICGLLAIGGFGCVFGTRDRWNYDKKVVIKTPYYMGDYCRPYIARSQNVFEKQIHSLNNLYEWEKKNLIGFSNAGFDCISNLNDYFFDRNLDLCTPFKDAAGKKYFVSEDLREKAPFLVMKYIKGVSLQDIIKRHPLNQIKTLSLTKQILLFLKHLHKKRESKRGRNFYYLLCDLKADNIIITNEEQISFIDFGGIKIHWLDQKEIDLPIFVTDGYAAPEVYTESLEYPDNTRIDCRFDIFTVGALMCHCLTSKNPASFLENRNPPQHNFDLSKFSIEPSLKKIILKSTSSNREDRYPDADAMLNDISSILDKFK